MSITHETLLEWVLLGLNSAPHRAKCKFCNSWGLEWVQSPEGKWYLVEVEGDQLRLHSCLAKAVKFKKVKFK